MPSTLFALFASGALAKPATNGIVYSPISVWPYPQKVQFPDPVGPHQVVSPTVDVAASCDNAITDLLGSALKQRVIFRDTVRSFDEKPYAPADAYCPTQSRCMIDGDCSGDEACFSDSSRRYNSTHACPPSAPFNSPCGCCAPTQGMPAVATISVVCDAKDVGGNEAYTLDVSADGIKLAAPTSHGAAYGIATLAQLLRWDSKLNSHVLDRVPLHISDAPTFGWRGMMLDTSRHFVGLSQIHEMIDAMYAAKMNTFHWHIVDAPSFPYGSALFPELASEGSWSQDANTIYSAADVEAVLEHAKKRYIEVVLEFDTPAHTMAWGRAHPEIMTDCWEWLAKENPKVDVDSDDCMAMDPTSPKAEKLVMDLLGEVMALGENTSRYLHLGGDEVKVGCWNASESIRNHVLQAYGDLSENSFKSLQLDWTKRLAKDSLLANGKIPVVWQPTGPGPADPVWDPSKSGMPDSTVYMAWLSSASVTAYAKAGSQVVNTQPFYIAGMGSGGWKQVYDADVAPKGLTDSERALVLGGQVCMWGETLGEGNFAMRAYQIGMGAAENFWGKNPSEEHGTWATQDRFNRFLCHLRNWGVVSPPQMPSYCGVAAAKPTTLV